VNSIQEKTKKNSIGISIEGTLESGRKFKYAGVYEDDFNYAKFKSINNFIFETELGIKFIANTPQDAAIAGEKYLVKSFDPDDVDLHIYYVADLELWVIIPIYNTNMVVGGYSYLSIDIYGTLIEHHNGIY